jgi:hypothetical protein
MSLLSLAASGNNGSVIMSISKQEATQALADVRLTRSRTVNLQNYRHFAPYMIVWGLVWLVANAITDLLPSQAGNAWLGGVAIGSAASFWLGIRTARADDELRSDGWRWGLTFALILGFFVAVFSVLPPSSGAQTNALISLFWAFVYMLAGAWTGWKIFAVGLAVAAATLCGYFMLESHYALWMALVGGGALLAGGLWLRRI